MILKTTANVKVSEFPTVPTQNEICPLKVRIFNSFGKTNYFKRNFLLRSAADLLPFQGDENFLRILLGDSIYDVLSTTDAQTDFLLFLK